MKENLHTHHTILSFFVTSQYTEFTVKRVKIEAGSNTLDCTSKSQGVDFGQKTLGGMEKKTGENLDHNHSLNQAHTNLQDVTGRKGQRDI